MNELKPNPFNLIRFLDAQEGIYSQALGEIRAGCKESHWMWFIFPQIDGLGRSSTAKFYAIRSRAEAKAYLEHPILGKRLIECSTALLHISGRSASEILGFPDVLKLRSSMTLFATVSQPDSVFAQVLDRYFAGERDPKTIELLF
ncbi:MAG: DUF1810 domain-containing protein [Limisphaerales bacterium]